ncbi:MAG: alternative ribosome rescue aminoacyl-tRNA hydrolase ArfB [Mycobacteriales bacterium]
MGIALRPGLTIPDRELDWAFSRSSGPGGQHVNTSDTRVSLSFDVAQSSALDGAARELIMHRLARRLVNGRLTVTASEYRSQWRNREAAANRLAALLGEALRPAGLPRHPTRPTRASRERRLEAKRRHGQLKAARRRPASGE